MKKFIIFLIIIFAAGFYTKAFATVSEEDWKDYYYSVKKEVKKHWHPRKSWTEDYLLNAVVVYTVNKDGEVIFRRIEPGDCTNKAFLSSVEAASNRVKKFRPLPSGFEGDKIRIEALYNYNLKGEIPKEYTMTNSKTSGTVSVVKNRSDIGNGVKETTEGVFCFFFDMVRIIIGI